MKKKSAYAAAGVDIDSKMAAIDAIKRMVKQTRTRAVLSDIGLFGGLFASPGIDKVLVASTDGVGTKLKVAAMAGRHDTVGQDLVNHCVNDILVQGASPLFFLDYVGTSKFNGRVFREVIAGLCKACRQNGCALLGGETAEMPGMYPAGEYDLVGTIVGVVARKRVITGAGIRPGDAIIGLGSSGLHTNGYSLARKVIFGKARLKIGDIFPGTRRTVAEVLLAVHKSYLHPIRSLMASVPVHGMAHITGGGFPDNVARIMPKGTCALIDRSTWKVPEVFRFVQKTGNVGRDEMYRVFNMGIGMVVIVPRRYADRALKSLKRTGARPIIIGRVREGTPPVKLVNQAEEKRPAEVGGHVAE